MQLFTRLFVLRLSKKRNNTLTKLKMKLFFFAIFDLRKGEMDCSYTGGVTVLYGKSCEREQVRGLDLLFYPACGK